MKLGDFTIVGDLGTVFNGAHDKGNIHSRIIVLA